MKYLHVGLVVFTSSGIFTLIPNTVTIFDFFYLISYRWDRRDILSSLNRLTEVVYYGHLSVLTAFYIILPHLNGHEILHTKQSRATCQKQSKSQF